MMAILRILSIESVLPEGRSAEYGGMPLARQMPGELSGSIEQRRRQVNKTLMHLLRQIRQARFNGDFGRSRDANVCDAGAKPRSPGRWARVLELTSSLRMAIQIASENRPYYHVRNWPRHSAQAKQSGEKALLISFS
jgi:hypothetical protein